MFCIWSVTRTDEGAFQKKRAFFIDTLKRSPEIDSLREVLGRHPKGGGNDGETGCLQEEGSWWYPTAANGWTLRWLLPRRAQRAECGLPQDFSLDSRRLGRRVSLLVRPPLPMARAGDVCEHLTPHKSILCRVEQRFGTFWTLPRAMTARRSCTTPC